MTDEEIRVAYLEMINNYTNQSFVDDETLPAVINLALSKLIDVNNTSPNVQSETEGGISKSYFKSELPPQIKMMIAPYRKLSW